MERRGEERRGEERKGKERKGKERKGKERKGKCLCEIQKWEPPPQNYVADSG